MKYFTDCGSLLTLIQVRERSDTYHDRTGNKRQTTNVLEIFPTRFPMPLYRYDSQNKCEVRLEEEYLAQAHPDAYRKYRQRVRRWL
jgi:hypothetical protein